MKQASIPLYIRFGEIPPDSKSKVYRGYKIVIEEACIVKDNNRNISVL